MAREKLSEKKNHYVIYFVKLLTSRHPTTATATTTNMENLVNGLARQECIDFLAFNGIS